MVSSLLLAGLSGCFQDFGQFEESDGGTSEDAADDVETDAGDVQGDTPADAEPDGQTPVEIEVGTTCSSDDDCGTDGLCRAGYCTADCSEDMACPSGSTCRSVGPERLCVLDCGPYESCQGLADRDDLRCVPEIDRREFGAFSSVYRGCLPDTDGDQVFDPVDNCPDTANGRQLDRDDDGMGDACDSDPLCHSAATDGVLDYGTVTYSATSFTAPVVAAHGWMPVVGGVDGEGNPVADFAILDRESGGWTTGSLPYIPDGVIVGDGPYEKYLAAPGVKDEDGDQVGPHLLLDRDGSVEFGDRYTTIYPADFLTSARFGRVYAFGEISENSLNWRLMRYNESADGYVSPLGIDFDAPSAVQWRATRDIDGDVVIYSDPDVTAGDATFTSVSYTGSTKQTSPLTMPMASTGQFFRPVVVPGLGGVFYAFDRNTGEAAVIDPVGGTIDVAPELNLDFGANVRKIISSPESASLIILSRPDVDSDELAAREIFIRCPGAVSERDSDGDGAIDTRDNCPSGRNGSQLDTDRDGIGDSCDQDVDGDGIPNPEDQIPSEDGTRFIGLDLDSDNDRIDNPDDDDDDGDGIPDGSDRFPLDTDNDGIPNLLDSDDDADGFSDTTERSSETDQFNQFDFPNAGTIAFFEDDGSSRTIKVGELVDLDNAVVREISSSGSSPSRLSFSDSGEDLVILDGEPGQTQQIRVGPVDTDSTRTPTSWQVGTTLRDVALLPGDISDGTVSSASVVTETADGFSLVRVTFNPQAQSVLVSDLRQVQELATDGPNVGVIGAPVDCPGCLGIYRFRADEGTAGRFLSNQLLNPRSPSLQGSTVYVVADNPDGTSSGFAVTTNRANEVRPPLVENVDSLVTGLGGGRNHLIVSGSSADSDTFNLYFFNRTRDRWYKLLTTSTDIVDVTWTRREPSLEQTDP